MTSTLKPASVLSALVATLLCALAITSNAFAATPQTDAVTVTTALSSEGTNRSAWVDSDNDVASFTFEGEDWSESYKTTDVDVVSDSSTTGYSWAYLQDEMISVNDDDEAETPKTYIALAACGRGTHKIVVRQTFSNAKGKALHYIDYSLTIKLKCVSVSKTNIVSYKGKKTTLSTNYLTGTVKWKSTNKKIATVTSKGIVKGKKLGKCYVQATGISQRTGETVTVKCLVEVTYKKAYKAVQNAWKDYRNSKLTYSQSKRMSKNYRDCSSYVSRCYWDSSLKRKLLVIGYSDAKSWSYTAAEQARWLNSHGKKVAKKAVSMSKLLPGDTIYYETGYAGQNDEYRHIDHAAIYVGGGVVLNTSSHGPYGCIGNRGYYKGDASIKFIGRPCK